MLRVLLIEDNHADARLIQLALGELPDLQFSVTVAESLAKALPLAHSGHYHAVLLDLSLPDALGLTGLRELALAVPRTPILVLTGLDDDALAIQASRHGAQDYLIKGTNDGAALSRAIHCAIERKAFEARLAERANFDSLTGLVNRALFLDRLTHALERAQRARTRAALMFIDLDRFKAVNDTLGHQVGDEVLRRVAEMLRRAVRASDTVARLGGDEFTVLLDPIEDLALASSIAERIRSALREPLVPEQAGIQVQASIGMAVFPDDATEVSSLLRLADDAMFHAKEAGRTG